MPTLLTRFGLLVMLALATLAQAAGLPESVDVNQAAALQKQGALLLDVREPDEFAEIHAKGAQLIPLGQLESRLNELGPQKDRPIAVICRSGRRSAIAAEILRRAGYNQVSNVSGGTLAWIKAGLPIEHR